MENKIIHGDNLLVMKYLLEEYRSKIKCIYIDPPYNTRGYYRNYLDRFNSDEWLQMMKPRLQIMRELLSNDGSIWISIDDNEVDYLKILCDEIFGRVNFVTHVIWEKKYSPQNDTLYLSDSHDFILVYARDKKIWRPNLLPRTDEMNARYKNPDNDSRGLWKATDSSSRGSRFQFKITSPTGKIFYPPVGRQWAFSEQTFNELLQDNRIWFGKDGNSRPSIKTFLSEVKAGTVAKTIWTRDEVGDNQEAVRELKSLNLEKNFSTPKPVRLIKKILQLSTDKESIVLDAFAGSGTTGQAVIELNAEDDGNRKFVLIESENYCESITAERIHRVNGKFIYFELN